MTAQSQSTHNSRLMALVSLTAICVGTLGLTGCGGSGATHSTPTAPTQTARPTDRQSNADIGVARVQIADSGGGEHRSRPSHQSSSAQADTPAGDQGGKTATAKIQQARPNHNPELNDSGQLGVKPTNPCKLVSRSEARSITGQALVSSIEAPLGPTCIYRFAGSKSEITLAVESVSFSQATQQLSKRTRVSVGRQQGYCGSLGTRMLFVPLPGAKVLHVTAPCAMAERFATLALSRLAA